MATLADEFKEWVSSRLQLRPSVESHGFEKVELHWFQPVETAEARKRWSECCDQKTPPPWTDILEVRCSFFNWTCDKGDVIVGCTPTFSKGHVLIQSGLAYYCTFRCIADECYHVYQDFSRGSSWRHETDRQFVEDEAGSFADSLAVLIRRFLETNVVFHK